MRLQVLCRIVCELTSNCIGLLVRLQVLHRIVCESMLLVRLQVLCRIVGEITSTV